MLLSWQLCSQNHGLGSRGRAAATKPLLGLMILSLRLALQALKYGGTLLAEKIHIFLHGFLYIFLYGGTLLAEKFHISLHGFLSIFLYHMPCKQKMMFINLSRRIRS